MKISLLCTLLSFAPISLAHASGAITIEITTTELKPSYTLHKKGYGDDSKSGTPEDIETWVRFIIPKIADPKLRIYIYTDARTSFTVIMDMLRHLKAAGAKHFVVCAGTGAYVQPELEGSFDDIRINFPPLSKGVTKASAQGATITR